MLKNTSYTFSKEARCNKVDIYKNTLHTFNMESLFMETRGAVVGRKATTDATKEATRTVLMNMMKL